MQYFVNVTLTGPIGLWRRLGSVKSAAEEQGSSAMIKPAPEAPQLDALLEHLMDEDEHAGYEAARRIGLDSGAPG